MSSSFVFVAVFFFIGILNLALLSFTFSLDTGSPSFTVLRPPSTAPFSPVTSSANLPFHPPKTDLTYFPENILTSFASDQSGAYTQSVKQQQEDPCQVKSKVVGDATYCDRYWECIGGQPELYDCPNGLVFAGKHRGVTEGCDYPWRANYCEGKQLANGPLSTEHCDWLYGIFGHETSCTRYWTCWNGTATEQLCIGGLLYNENTHSCDWPENVDGCQKHPLCNDDANGNVPLGKSCNRYWQCQGGYPRLQRCPAMLVFDRRSLRCVVPPTEDCDVPTTQPPPPEEEEEENLPPQDLRGRPQSFAGNHRNQPREEINLPNLPQGAIPLPVRNRN